MNNVAPKIKHKWDDFGLLLRIPLHILNSLKKAGSYSDFRCFMEVVEYWKTDQYSKTGKLYSYTWKSLIEVLTSPHMNERPLAAEIEKYLGIITPVEEKHDDTPNMYQSTTL